MTHKVWIDYLRVIAIVAVIAIHVTTVFYKQYADIGPFNWWFANLLDSASRFSVPLFVMASGVVLLGRSIAPPEFLRKRAWRLLPPILFWNALYLVLGYFLWNPEHRSLLDILATTLRQGYSYGHLWYLTMFACLMLFAPFINLFVRGEAPGLRDFAWLAGLFLLFAAVHQAAVVVEEASGTEIAWYALFPLYLLYFIGGYVLDRFQDRIHCPASVLIAVIAGTIALGAVLNFGLYRYAGIEKDYLALYNVGPLVILCTFAVFQLLRQNAHRLNARPSISAWSDASFGIYLIHPLLIFVSMPLSAFFEDWLALFMVLDIAGVALVSFLLISLLRRLAWFRLIS